MSRFLVYGALTGLFGGAAIGFYSSWSGALAFIAGWGLGLADIGLLYHYIRRGFEKKQVALTTGVIVIKYLILGAIIYFARTQLKEHFIWFAAGLFSLIFGSGLFVKALKKPVVLIIGLSSSNAFAAGAGGHFSWMMFLPGVQENHLVHVATMAAVSLLTVFLAVIARFSLGHGEVAIAPAGRLSVRGFFEVVLEFINGMAEMVIGHHGRKFAPMFASIFLFIFLNNVVGLLPGMTAATDNLNSGLALGLFSFVVYNYYGIKENGIGYLKHFMANMTNGAWLIFGLVLLVLELISHLVRPFSLGLRLMANLQGDHTILGVFTDFWPHVGIPLPFYFLGLFVCFMQAFIFTVLSMVYISIATAHDH